MKRKTKRFSALLLAAAMTFGLSMSAFAEPATPETALSSVKAVALQSAEQSDSAATLSITRQEEGMILTVSEQNYDNFQDALNALASVQVDKSNDDANAQIYYSAAVTLDKDVTGAFTVPAYTGNIDGYLPTLYFDGHTITGQGGPALTMSKNALLYISDTEYTGGINGDGSHAAILVEDTEKSSLWIDGGTYTAFGALVISLDATYDGLVQVRAGRFNQKQPDYMLCPDNEYLSYRQVSKDSYWEVESYETPASSDVVAKVGNDTYATLQAAVDVASGNTITLVQDVTESVIVPENRGFTLDLNGHTLKAESGKDYAIRCNNGESYIRDTSADKTGAVYGTVDFANTQDSINFIQGGNFHATTGPAIITAGGVTVSGGSFHGAANQPVLDTHEGSKTPGYCFMGGSEIRAGEGGKIFDGFDGLTEMNFILTHYCSSENTKFYGDLGVSAARIQGGYFDRQVPANLLAEGYTQAQENGMWHVFRDTSNDPAVVTGADGTNQTTDTLYSALRYATQLSAENNATYTVTLKRDVTENTITSWYTEEGANKPKIELDLNGHTLTAQSADAAALSASNVEIFLRGNEGTINGRVESDSYLWIIHTTVNALEGQPAIANLSKENDSLSIKGTSVINGAADQAAIVSNGKTTVGDGSKVVAGAGGTLFQKGEKPAEVCFFLDYCTLYGDLGDADTLDTIQVNVSNGKSFTKFDREPSLKVAGYVAAKGSDGLYTYVTAPVSAMVGSQEFQTLQEAIDYAAANGGTPKMIKSLTEDITTPAGTMTIDMNGCTLTGNVTAGGTLNLKNGSVNGKITLGNGAALNFTNHSGLDNATLPDGYTLSVRMDANGYYNVVPYDKKLHETVKNAVEQVNAYLAGIDSSYKLETLTDDQINALAGKAFGDDSNPINAQYNAVKALDQSALQNHLDETRIGETYRDAIFTLVSRLYSAANMEIKTGSQQVEATVDTTKTELPKTEEEIPEDKQPTQQDAADKAEALKDELTGDNAAVKDFKDNNLTNTVKIKSLPKVQDDSTVELYVQAQLQDIKLGAAVEKDADGNVTEVKLNGQTLVFDVTPMAKVDDNDAVEIGNDLLNGGSVVFRLPIPAEVTEKYAKVAHAGDADRYVEIKTEDGKKYIELSATHFSIFTVSFTNELPQPVEPAQPAAPAQSSSDNTGSTENSQSTTTTAPKQDDSAYYTCKACGYHDWTAVEGGYKCNHCGYVESVKQLAGYPNVKGTATVGKTAAAAKTSGTMSAIPQTSDDMPVTALAVAALAALLGLGVTVIAKRKNSK